MEDVIFIRTNKNIIMKALLNTVVMAMLLGQAHNSYGDLSRYVDKYTTISISHDQLQDLSHYSHFITYFSRIPFFRPRHRVSPDFIKALILAESNCNQYAVSSDNALGLGQILYSTGREAARDIYNSGRTFKYINRKDLKALHRDDLFNPAINILLTCYLISKYNYKFNGKLELVVSAWNAGENVGSLQFGLPAPYSETYNLIGKINGYYVSLLKLRR